MTEAKIDKLNKIAIDLKMSLKMFEHGVSCICLFIIGVLLTGLGIFFVVSKEDELSTIICFASSFLFFILGIFQTLFLYNEKQKDSALANVEI